MENMEQKWCRFMMIQDVKYIKIEKDREMYIKLKEELKEMYKRSMEEGDE